MDSMEWVNYYCCCGWRLHSKESEEKQGNIYIRPKKLLCCHKNRNELIFECLYTFELCCDTDVNLKA